MAAKKKFSTTGVRNSERAAQGERATIEQIFEEKGLPGWLGWGTYEAESSAGKALNDGGFGFGLIEPSYSGKSPKAGDTYYNAEISAELYQHLTKTNPNGLAGAVTEYSGNSYGISHVSSLGKAGTKPSGAFAEEHPNAGSEDLGEPDVLPGVSALENLGNPLDALIGIGEVFKVMGELLFTPAGWLRIGKLAGGALFFVWGLEKIMTSGTTPTGGTAGKFAKDAAIAAIVK